MKIKPTEIELTTQDIIQAIQLWCSQRGFKVDKVALRAALDCDSDGYSGPVVTGATAFCDNELIKIESFTNFTKK